MRRVFTAVTLACMASLVPAGAVARSTPLQATQQSSGQTDNAQMHKQLAEFAWLISQHEDLESALRSDPNSANNPQFLQSHPQLQEFLQTHSEIAEQLKANPSQTVSQALQMEQSGDVLEIREQKALAHQYQNLGALLQKDTALLNAVQGNPSLLIDQTTLSQHPDLQAYFKENPNIYKAAQANPQQVLARALGTSAEPTASSGGAASAQPDNDDRQPAAQPTAQADNDAAQLHRQQVAFAAFLNQHEDIEQALRTDPASVNNPQFLQSHPQLQKFIQARAALAEELKENPSQTMNQVLQMEQNTDNLQGREAKTLAHQYQVLGRLLQRDTGLMNDVKGNPSLLTDGKTLSQHPRLRAYFKENPNILRQAKENPQQVLDHALGSSK